MSRNGWQTTIVKDVGLKKTRKRANFIKNETNDQNNHEYEKEEDEIEDNSEGVAGVFASNTLRITNGNCNFQLAHQ